MEFAFHPIDYFREQARSHRSIDILWERACSRIGSVDTTLKPQRNRPYPNASASCW
jgi:hypothetical protein